MQYVNSSKLCSNDSMWNPFSLTLWVLGTKPRCLGLTTSFLTTEPPCPLFHLITHNIQGFKIAFFCIFYNTRYLFLMHHKWFLSTYQHLCLGNKNASIEYKLYINIIRGKNLLLTWKIMTALWNFIRAIGTNKTRIQKTTTARWLLTSWAE